ncbi:MAG: DUF4240 domain-containing protein [Candidatus Obscuribacterales bacterium]|nr:DUF4240 domain-containing protein [Candidatus Obscuribacterales bacterium]
MGIIGWMFQFAQRKPIVPISIRISGKNNSGSPNKFTYPVRCRIEEDFAQAALSSFTQSPIVKTICINLILSESTSPTPPYIGRVSSKNKAVAAGIELPWLVEKDVDELMVQKLMGKPLLALLLATFKNFDVPAGAFLKSLSEYSGWSEIILSLSPSELDSVFRFASLTPVTMNEDAFWAIIEKSKRGSSSNEQQEGHLIAELSKLPAEDIGEFNAIFHIKMAELYRWDLWAIAYIINNGCSDDGFTEFRAWLICQGQDFYKQAIIRPDFVGEQVPVEAGAYDASDTTCYGFDLVAGRVYEEKTGFKVFTDFSSEPREPIGYRWDEDELPSMFPSVCRKFRS